jgi:hypothetical protein
MKIAHKPWDVNPALARERLEFLAQLLLTVALEAFAGHEPGKGDGRWGLGCRRYERSRYALLRVIAAGETPWLKIVPDTGPLSMNLGIGGCPIRLVSGDSIHPDQHHVIRAQEQYELWPSAPAANGWYWLLIVERDGDGKATQVVVEQANELGDVRYRWIAARTKDAEPTPSIAKAGVDVPPPMISGPNGGKKVGNDNSGEQA